MRKQRQDEPPCRDDSIVALDPVTPEKTIVRWSDHGIPRSHEYLLSTIAQASSFPETPASWSEVPAELINALAEATATYAEARMPFTLRSRDQILGLFDGFDLVEPGLVSLPEWRPDYNTDRTPLNGPTVGAVARLAA